MGEKEFYYKELSYRIRGAFFQVYNTLGPGQKEVVYHNALTHEFKLSNIQFDINKKFAVKYKGGVVGFYQPDFIVDNKVIVEIKAIPNLIRLNELQVFYYIRNMEQKLAFLVNFGAEKLEIKRIVKKTE
ncbi:MAG: GxxExxY protein [Elusimicrobiota bacterium]